ncbi:vWA domain-containing protein [Roseimaritima sediminicola]|uniref:vWA domain-containing protein n=1 Tax=Roseimaritima sediminicola TaxID=2662066 RepID=UPI00129843AB|nr:vWA domain-containing protein [Roseimaritima sediminicola]
MSTDSIPNSEAISSAVVPSEPTATAAHGPAAAERAVPGSEFEAIEQQWEEADDFEVEEEDWFNDESVAFVASLVAHMAILLTLAMMPVLIEDKPPAVVLVSPPPEYEQETIERIEDITYSDVPHEKVGANSEAESEMAEASAEMFAEVAEIPQPVELQTSEISTVNINEMFQQAVAPVDRLKEQRGKTGVGALGAAGAVDRLTWEILQSMEERPTLVVWLFDKSGSLHRQRQEIRDRFDRIYEELQIVQKSGSDAFQRSNPHEEQLLTSIIGFGESVELLTEEPIADLQAIKDTVDNIEVDSSGVEQVFSAVYLAAKEYKGMRRHRLGFGPQRNVMLVVVTDERGDDYQTGLEPTVEICRRYGMPVYVIGVPAPFGRETTYVKYVDPDPKYDQSPQWAEVDQGPETVMPERVRIGFTGDYGAEPVLDSGFGPYALTRLCYETGGIYFTVHPNRNVNRRVRRGEIEAFSANLEYFFDPVKMAPYRPDYVSPEDYMRMVKASPLRQALIKAAQMPGVEGLDRPRTRFVKRSEAALVGELSNAQRDAARLEPRLAAMAEVLLQGEAAREEETSPRWQAGYDLALGRVLALKVRTETYNAMLAKAKRGIGFENEKNNTWKLEPAAEISVGSKWQREAEKATELLRRVADEHEGTPWALLAKEELATPIGWKWVEQYTDLDPPRPAGNNNNNNNNNPPQDDQKRMLKRAPKRPLPKL